MSILFFHFFSHVVYAFLFTLSFAQFCFGIHWYYFINHTQPHKKSSSNREKKWIISKTTQSAAVQTPTKPKIIDETKQKMQFITMRTTAFSLSARSPTCLDTYILLLWQYCRRMLSFLFIHLLLPLFRVPISLSLLLLFFFFFCFQCVRYVYLRIRIAHTFLIVFG